MKTKRKSIGVKGKRSIKTRYYKKNKEVLLAYQNAYNERNRGMINSKNRNRELHRKYGTPIQTCPRQLKKIAKLYTRALQKTRETGVRWVVDHKYPASKGGKHEFKNMQVITASENQKKYWSYDRYLPHLKETTCI